MAISSKYVALTNPIENFLNKAKEDFTRQDLLNLIVGKQIERITFHYTGIDGKIKELRIPINSIEQAEQVLADGERVDGSSLFKGLVEVGKSDLYVVPVYKSAFLNPFEESSLDFLCKFINPNGELTEFAPDNILTKAHNMLKQKHGFGLLAHAELEFYLISDCESSNYILPEQRGYHAASPYAKTGKVVDEMLRIITQITGTVKYAHNEVGYIPHLASDKPELNGKFAEQVEIEFSLSDVETAGDNVILAEWIIRNVASRHGMLATFYPKIEPEQAGTGFHIHMALSKDGHNSMCNKNGELTKDARKLIGGLCKFAPSLTAFGNMVSASYLRLVPGQEAPTKVYWSDSNRSALIRVPLAWTKVNNLAKVVNKQQTVDYNSGEIRQTVELRSPDGSANVHLLLAGIIMAVEWGLANEDDSLELASRSRVDGKGSNDDEIVHELTTSCVNSAELFLSKRRYYEHEKVFPPKVVDYVGEILMAENDKDLNSKLLSMAEDERFKESRKIMHSGLYRY